MSKRHRVSQSTHSSSLMNESRSNREDDSLHSACYIGPVEEHQGETLNGNQVVKFKAHLSRKKHRKFSVKDYFNILFPHVSIRINGYGTCLTGFNSGTDVVGPSEAMYQNSIIGNTIWNGCGRYVHVRPSQASVVEYVHLGAGYKNAFAPPAAAYAATSSNTCPSTGITLNGLMAYARDAVNISGVQLAAPVATKASGPVKIGVTAPNAGVTTVLDVYNSFGNVAGDPSLISTVTEKGWANYQRLPNNETGDPLFLQNNLQYSGGFTLHRWTNVSNIDIILEFWICTPKSFLAFEFDPISCAAASNAAQIPFIRLANNPLSPDGGIGNAVLRVNDAADNYQAYCTPLFNLNSKQHLLHEFWHVGKPKRCVVNAGALVEYKVPHPAFSYTDSPWNQSLIGGTSATDLKDKAYYPFCTSVLVMKAHGQVVKGTATGVLPTAVNFGKATLMHTQTEYHGVRGGIVSQQDQNVFLNYQNDNLPNEREINQLTNAAVDVLDNA